MSKTTVGAGRPTCARSWYYFVCIIVYRIFLNLFNWIIPNTQQSANAIDLDTPSLSLEDEVFYDALDQFPDDNLEDIFYDASGPLGEPDDEAAESQPFSIPSLTRPVKLSDGIEYKGIRKGRPVAQLGIDNGALNAPATNYDLSGGLSTPVAPPTTTQQPCQGGTLTDRARSVSAPRSSQKKAVLIGLNYERYGRRDLRLNQAIQDARRFANVLTKLGYSSENMRVVTDEKDQPFPAYRYLMECIDWLVQDASKGDRLFFMFSGHCQPSTIGKREPYLVAADLMDIPQSTFQERLVAKVPAGAELTIVLDCCNAAGMVKLKYCVGRMDYKTEIKQMNKLEALSELENPAASVIHEIPQHGSLHGLKKIAQETQAPRTTISQVPFGVSLNAMRPQHLNRGVVAARPLFSGTRSSTGPLFGLMASLPQKELRSTGSSSPPFTKQRNPGRGRQLVVEGLSPIPYFEERKDEFISPAGKVLVWAGTGYSQKAFESSSGAKNSIVTDAMCKVLETCPDSPVTQRDVWDSLVGAIDEENSRRDKHDAKKTRRPPPNLRVQCAELWVSQEEPLRSPSPILDQRILEMPESIQ